MKEDDSVRYDTQQLACLKTEIERTYSCTIRPTNIQVLWVETRLAGKRKIAVGYDLDPCFSILLHERVSGIFTDEGAERYFVCTSPCGAWRGLPYLFGANEVTKIELCSTACTNG